MALLWPVMAAANFFCTTCLIQPWVHPDRMEEEEMEPQRDPAHQSDLERCEVFAEQSATGEFVLRLAGSWTLQNRIPPLEEVRKSLEPITGV